MNEDSMYVVDSFSDVKNLSGITSYLIKTRGHHIYGVGSAGYLKDGSTGEPSSGDESKTFDADGNGWILDQSQKIDAKMFGLIGFGDNQTDETDAFLKMLNYSSNYGVKVSVPVGEYGYYLLGEIYVPDNTYVKFSPQAVFKARDDLRQTFTNTSPFEVLFRFSDTKGAIWHCNRARMYYDKSKYSGEHNHIFMFDGASDLFIYDPFCQDAGGDGFYVGGRFSTSRHCTNIHLFRPYSSQARRNNLSVTSCDGLFVYNYDFRSAGINGGNPSGPCAGIDVEPETYTDALRARFYGGRTQDNLRQGMVFAMTKLPAGVVVDIQVEDPYSYSDSRGFEFTRLKADHSGVIRLVEPIAEKSRYASFHGINSASTGILCEMIYPLAIDPSVSTDAQNGGGAAYYFNNFNDGSPEEIYPQKFGGIRLISPAIKYFSSVTRPNYCARVNITSSTINDVSNIQADNVEIKTPLFKRTDYAVDCFNVTVPSGVGYNPVLNITFDSGYDYRKDNVGNGFNARSYPGGYFTNYGATQNITVNLNDAVPGRSYKFLVLSAMSFIVNPGGTNIIPDISSNTGSQRLISNTIGSRLELLCEDIDGIATWFIKSMSGTWNVS